MNGYKQFGGKTICKFCDARADYIETTMEKTIVHFFCNSCGKDWHEERAPLTVNSQ